MVGSEDSEGVLKCGRYDKDGQLRIDSFISDVYDEEVECVLCDECYQERVWDIYVGS